MNTVLLAVPENWRTELREFLAGHHINAAEAASYEAALSAIEEQAYAAIIVVLQWAWINSSTSQFWQEISENTPVLLLIPRGTDYRWFDVIYTPPLHDYCTLPVGTDEIAAFFK